MYSGQLNAEHFNDYVYHGDIAAYISFQNLELSEGAGANTVNTNSDDEVWLAVRVKCVAQEATEWAYKLKSAGVSNAFARVDCPEGVDSEWSEHAIWADD